MAQHQLQTVRDLISAGHYAEARALLLTIDHPVAREWLVKLNQISPPTPPPPFPTYYERPVHPEKRVSCVGRIARILALAILIFAGLIIAAMSLSSQTRPGRAAQIEYRITGSAGSVSLTYVNDSGNIEQRERVYLPFRLTFQPERGQMISIVAQNKGASGTVRCAIVVNGNEIETAEAQGGYQIATCTAGPVP